MNYITEINRFYDWLETNPLTDSSIVLWHALMHINNKCEWKQEFAVAISSIQNKTGLSKSSILRARNCLQQNGRISFTSRNGQQSAIYSMIAFHTETQSETQTGTQSGAINKLNYTKLNNSISHRGEKSPPDEKKASLVFWQEFVDTWNSFYLEKQKEKFEYQKKDFGCLKKIYGFLKKRSEQKGYEWNQKNMTEAFRFFLDLAWEKDEWIRQNFELGNLVSKFNSIVNAKKYNNGRNHTSKNVPVGIVIESGQRDYGKL